MQAEFWDQKDAERVFKANRLALWPLLSRCQATIGMAAIVFAKCPIIAVKLLFRLVKLQIICEHRP